MGLTAMPCRLPPHVERFVSKGKTYLYFRRGKGPRTPLPSDPTSDEFSEAYAAALAGAPKPVKPVLPSEVAGTIAALITDYMKHGSYRGLRETTKKGYISRLEVLRVQHGHRTVAGMTRAGVQTKILDPYADRPGAAHSILKMLRILISHAIARDWIKHDPTVGIRRPKLKEVRSWTDAEIAAFETRWPVGTKERTAFALQLYTGQRRSDVHRMTWADVGGGVVHVVQQKTGEKVWVAMHRDLATVLAAAPREHVTILNTAFGKSFTVDGYGNWLRDAITAAGLPLDAKPHGLRKAAGRRLADAGCTAHEIMAVLGHKTLAGAERYTREADKRRLGVSAITKLEGRKKNRNAQTASGEFGKMPKT